MQMHREKIFACVLEELVIDLFKFLCKKKNAKIFFFFFSISWQ
jgi:hypothetical protein